ncbi:flagellar hook-length control protein FliK [Alkalimonas amylolytica]|uniref:Flagellar hook-length control protein FliK n=1 Tax=Alkalimonas amylolytica TaxID=152573 RepID=A0A1H4BN80_ALKAM|nr:flagellar hook-length control protein FliK [Alkalimonas amylolytica]SEA49508.1 Flagellar hook-length control protein FliK [Alkalimonas amylolytica]
MADALQMFLMTGSPLQLGAGTATKADDAEAPLNSETLPFAAQLAEAGEQPVVLTERQKAAASSVQESMSPEPVNPESLQAIITDEQSSADDKDAARAWLAIIRAGQQESASITVTAASVKQGRAFLAEAQGDKEERPNQLGSSALLTASAQSTMATESDVDKASIRLDVKVDVSKASNKSETAAVDESAQEVHASARKAKSKTVTDKQLLAVQTGELATEKSAVSNDNKADAPKGSLVQAVGQSTEAQVRKTASQDVATDDVLETEVEPSEKVLPADITKQWAAEAASQPAKPKESRVDGVPASKPDPVDEQSDDNQPQLLQDSIELTASPVPTKVALADAGTQPQTLAGAVQARAEARGSVVQPDTQSGQQKSGEQKEQSAAHTAFSAMQQAQAEHEQASGGRFDAAMTQEHAAIEHSQQRTQNSNQFASSQGLTGQNTSSPATAASTAQMVQSQGSASVQTTSVTPSVSELLKQPLNLLTSDAPGQLRERLVMMVRNSVHSAEIKLDPAELGSMHIRVSMQQDQASVQFLVQQAHAKEILEEQLPKLRDMLGEQGIELTDGQVSQQQSGQQQQNAGGNGKMNDEEDLMQEQRLPVAKPTNRLVDYYA